MVNNEINTVTLTKSTYDCMRSTNDRANMLLREMMSAMSIANDSDTLTLDNEKIIKTIEILYPDSYKKKVSTLKMMRTKNYLKSEVIQ